MRKLTHRLLTGFPAFAVAILALLAAANPPGARLRLSGFIELMSDQRFLWLCIGIVAAYFLSWWLTSIEPRSRRSQIQAGLKPHYEAINRWGLAIKHTANEDELTKFTPDLEAVLTEAGNWILDNMGRAAFEKFKIPRVGSLIWTWPGQSPVAAQKRSNIICLNEARLEVLSEFLRYDAWDGEAPSLRQRALKRIEKWKTRKSASLLS